MNYLENFKITRLCSSLIIEKTKEVEILDDEAEGGIIYATVNFKLKTPSVCIDVEMTTPSDAIPGGIYVDENHNRYVAVSMMTLKSINIYLSQEGEYKVPDRLLLFSQSFNEGSDAPNQSI